MMTAYDRYVTAYPPHWDNPAPEVIGYEVIWYDGKVSELFEPGLIADEREAEAHALFLDFCWSEVCARLGYSGSICASPVYEGER